MTASVPILVVQCTLQTPMSHDIVCINFATYLINFVLTFVVSFVAGALILWSLFKSIP
jgi:hypothetical protein